MEHTYRQTDRQIYGQTDRQTDSHIKGEMHEMRNSIKYGY